MPSVDLIREGERILTICNACRYCEGFCAVFPAVEERRAFKEADLSYLANLCHNCSECLYACQYAPPHAFSVNVPRTLAELRLRTYERSAWPPALAGSFRAHGVTTALALAAAMTLVVAGASAVVGVPSARTFYGVLPHHAMVALFGTVFTAVVLALAAGGARYAHATKWGPSKWGQSPFFDKKGDDRQNPVWIGLRDALTLRYLHGSGENCTTGESRRTPSRRWLHHLTSYGFLLCFASTTVAAVYHAVFGWIAPYPVTSAPVVLGSLGGAGLLVGPFGLWLIDRRRDAASLDPEQTGLTRAFILSLLLTSATGFALLLCRGTAAMPSLLFVHLGVVLALFVTLPYGKFVHGLYRTAALIQAARERARP